jgi:3'-phosphoadenosine 5'-phosphosulfate sulfotransferase (PAPS reductase)/FAD synthetase
MNLTDYDVILINTSAGKDSQAMMDYVVGLAKTSGCLHKVIAVHCDLGRVEWKGARELALEHCKHYGIHLHIVSRPQGDLLEQIEARGMFPDSANRYCTSDQKRGQVAVLITTLTNEFIALNFPGSPDRKVKVLNCMGFRAEESAARAKRKPFQVNERLTNGKRECHDWLPIHTWTVQHVWQCIRQSGVNYHYAYDLGMPRLSCCFCIFASEDALMIAGKHNPELLTEYVRVETKIDHTFRKDLSLASIKARLDAGEEPPKTARTWTM